MKLTTDDNKLFASVLDVRVRRTHPLAMLPAYATAGAACFDLHACFDVATEKATLNQGGRITVSTGLAFEIPAGWCMQVFSRSGHGFKHDIRLINSVGIIDSDYRGEVKVCLSMSMTGSPLVIRHGDRIAQAMLVPAQRCALQEVSELSETARGTGGFGSTGA